MRYGQSNHTKQIISKHIAAVSSHGFRKATSPQGPRPGPWKERVGTEGAGKRVATEVDGWGHWLQAMPEEWRGGNRQSSGLEQGGVEAGSAGEGRPQSSVPVQCWHEASPGDNRLPSTVQAPGKPRSTADHGGGSHEPWGLWDAPWEKDCRDTLWEHRGCSPQGPGCPKHLYPPGPRVLQGLWRTGQYSFAYMIKATSPHQPPSPPLRLSSCSRTW